MSYTIGFIGGGNMSTAIANGILRNDDIRPSRIWVSGPHIKNLQHWQDSGMNITTKNGQIISTCDIVFLGVKPGILDVAVAECLNDLSANRTNILLISMLAGISIERLRQAFSVLPPNINLKIIRMMPNTPMMVGVGSCLYTPDENVAEDDCKLFENLLNKSAVIERVNESLIDSLGALTACGPAFFKNPPWWADELAYLKNLVKRKKRRIRNAAPIRRDHVVGEYLKEKENYNMRIYIIIEALADGAVKQGVPRAMALRQAAQMVTGSGQMVLQTGKHPGQLKDEVCSPGGSTICGVTALEKGQIRATLINAIEAATLRNKEMGKK